VAIVDSVTLVSLNGFNFPVTMALDSIRPVESTISVSFDPNPVTPPPYDSIKTGMRITTQSGTPPNNYRLFFRGTGNSVARLSKVIIKVIGPSFDLHYLQSYSLSPGDTVRDSIGVLSRYHFSSPVTITIDSIRPFSPYNPISVSFEPNPVTPPPNDSIRTQIRIETGLNVDQGYHTIYGHGAAGGVTKRFAIFLRVNRNTFDMVQSASAEVLVPNSSVVSSVYLSATQYYSSPVVMRVDSVRPAVPTIFVAFNPDSVWLWGNHIVWIEQRTMAQSGTPLGHYVVYYRGAGWGVTRCLTLSLKVVAQPFEVSCTPRRQEVHRWGDIVDYNLSLTSLVSYPSACTLSATVVPPGSPIAVGFLSDGVVVVSGARTMRVHPGEGLAPGTYVIRVQARSGDWTGVMEDTLVYAVSYYLGPAMPSPSRGSTVISYGLPGESAVSLKVYDLSGRLIRTLISGRERAGYHKVSWDGWAEGGKGIGSGVYFYRLVAGSWTKTMKMVVIK
jgi:hypothetical protein